MVKLQLPKLAMRVRFPLLAPKEKGAEGHPSLLERIIELREIASSCKRTKGTDLHGAT